MFHLHLINPFQISNSNLAFQYPLHSNLQYC
nr:MAG TPA: hypothetical protein [Crassvirales sp.]